MSETVQIDKNVNSYGYAIEAATAFVLIGAGWYFSSRQKKVVNDDDFTQV